MISFIRRSNLVRLYLCLTVIVALSCIVECRKKNNHYKTTAAEDVVVQPPSPSVDKKISSRTNHKTVNTFIYNYFLL